MLEQIKIENFQPFQKMVIPLRPGLNAIVGPNDCGKSAILRALRWLCRNAFHGTFFIRRGEISCAVGAVVNKDSMVIRRVVRSSTGNLKENSYSVINRTGEVQEFEKFKNDVPDEVAAALDISPPLVLGKDLEIDLNFAGQHTDAVFLLDRPGSVAARLLSRIVNLDIVLDAMRNLSAQSQRMQRDAKQLRAEGEELQRQVDAFPLLTYQQTFSELDAKVKELDRLQTSARRITEIGDGVKRLAASGREAADTKKQLDAVLTLPFDAAEKKLSSMIALKKVLGALTKLVEESKVAQQRAKTSGDLYGKANVCWEQWSAKAVLMTDVLRIQKDIKEGEHRMVETEAAYKLADDDYHLQLDAMGVCPTCERPL